MEKIIKAIMVTLVLYLVLGCSEGETAGKAAPAQDFTLKTLDGKEVTLSSLKGKKVLLDFFATWCPPCREELKEINEIVGEYKQDNYAILCISVDNAVKTVEKFISKYQYKMIVLFDDKEIARSYGVTGIPSLFLVDENGDIVWSQAGALTKEELVELLKLKK